MMSSKSDCTSMHVSAARALIFIITCEDAAKEYSSVNKSSSEPNIFPSIFKVVRQGREQINLASWLDAT